MGSQDVGPARVIFILGLVVGGVLVLTGTFVGGAIALGAKVDASLKSTDIDLG